MVVKTDLCAFSEFKIYPGHGIKFVRKDGQPVTLLNSKCKSLYRQRKKPTKLTWTTAWRRLNKKDKRDDHSRSRRRKIAKIQKPIVGISLDAIKKKKAEKPSERTAARDAAAKEIKDRQKKKKATVKK